MTRRTVVSTETIGPFVFSRTDDGVEWLKIPSMATGGFRPRPATAALTLERLRELVQAIDAAPDRATLARLSTEIEQRYVGDVAARALLDWVTQRAQVLSAPPSAERRA